MDSYDNSSGQETLEYTPLLGALIQNRLNLTAKKYEPGNPESTMLKIVDSAGNNAGYHTFVEKLMDATVSLGVRVFYQHTLHSISTYSGGDVQLQFEDGQLIKSARV